MCLFWTLCLSPGRWTCWDSNIFWGSGIYRFLKFWNINEPPWNHFEVILKSFSDHFGILLGSFWDHFGIILGSFWDRSGIMLGSFWDHFGIILESFWKHSGIILKSCWDHFGIILELFRDHVGIIFNHCGIILFSLFLNFVHRPGPPYISIRLLDFSC